MILTVQQSIPGFPSMLLCQTVDNEVVRSKIGLDETEEREIVCAPSILPFLHNTLRSYPSGQTHKRKLVELTHTVQLRPSTHHRGMINGRGGRAKKIYRRRYSRRGDLFWVRDGLDRNAGRVICGTAWQIHSQLLLLRG